MGFSFALCHDPKIEAVMLKGLARKLVRRLAGDQPEFREADALLKAADLPAEAVRRLLPSYLASNSWQVRNVAIKLIERLQDPALYPVLVQTVHKGTDAGIVVRNAVAIIRRLGLKTPDVELALQRALAAQYWEVRCEAIRSLAELFEYTPTRSELIIRALQPRTTIRGGYYFMETNFEVRAAAAMALGGFGRPETALPVLEGLAADPHWMVRCQAAVAITELSRRYPEIVPRAGKALDAIDPLSDGCRSDFPFPQTVAALRKAVDNGLAKMEPAAIRGMYIDMQHGWNRKRQEKA